MGRPRNFAAWTLSGTLLALVLPIIGTAITEFLFPEFRFVHLQLHSLIEGSGGLIALAIAGILLTEYAHKSDTDHYPWMAAGFLSMGLLDMFHAGAIPGNHFDWLRSTATLFGSACFGLVWTAPAATRRLDRLMFPAVVLLLTLVFGAMSIMASSQLPAMRTVEGDFSPTADTLNVTSCVGFLAAAAFFLRRFWETGDVEDWLFAVQTALFGVAGILFAYSVPWDGGWWWSHALRLIAYVIALSYGLRTFRNAERNLRHLNEQLRRTNAALDQTVEERTARLRAIEERFELAVRGSTDGLWDWNIGTNEVYYSARLKELLGYADDEFPNVFETFETHLHPDDYDWVLRRVNEHLRDHKPYDVEYRLRAKSGQYRWCRARGQAIWNAAGQATRMAGSITDVTEEHGLRERFRLAVEASPVALLMVHEDGQILMANSRCLALFGYSESELIGQPIEKILPARQPAENLASAEPHSENQIPRGMGTDAELSGIRKDGSQFPVNVERSPVETAEGQTMICGVLDVTDQRRTLAVLRQAKEAAESASRAKSSFLANMSHEIRTPMNGIIGMAQLLAQTELKSHQRDYLATVEESAHILLRLLNDILDFSKIEAGKLELECVDFRISECVARASQMLVLRAIEKGLEIACRIAPEIPDHLRGDPGRLQQVLVNLLGNAVKFTEVGEIFVDVNAEEVTEDRVRLRFSVSDTGIGVPADKLVQIFRPFEQAETSTTRRFGGTGLGLTISRQLVEMMHGTMWIESEVGRGSMVHCTAEFGVAADQHLHEPAELDSLRDLPVLVVDDNLTNRKILSEMLQHWHMQPVLAESAAAARAALQSAEQSQHPIRLILLDHHMPGEDGLHFAKSLRGTHSPGRCPIIMISSGSSPSDADLGQKYGIDRFMTKPVIASELLNEVLRQFGRYSKVKLQSSRAAMTSAPVVPRKVLLVEDNEINRRVAVGLLHSRGHQTVLAENGQQAVDRVAEQEFDVVLMDMQMPVMDGYEATTAIRKRELEFGGHVPIVAMTAEALKGDRERCLETGMDDYVSKPINPDEMYRAIERFPAICLGVDAGLGKSSRRPADSPGKPVSPVETPAAAPSPPTELPNGTVDGDVLPAVDWKVAHEICNGGREILNELSKALRSQTPTLLADVQRAIETRDSKLLQLAAHTIKGSASYFGAEPLVQAALKLENQGRSGSFEGSAGMLATLEVEVARVMKALEAGPPDSESGAAEPSCGMEAGPVSDS